MIVSNYQYGKPGGTAPSDFTRGYAGGVADARTAWQLHSAAGGGQSAPIFFSVDDDIDREAWNSVVLPWFRGINSVIGVQRTGIYGGIKACQWAAADGVIGRSRTPGHVWAWQTRSWSGGQIYPAAVLYQRIIDTASNPGPVVGGHPKSTSTTCWPRIAASGTSILMTTGRLLAAWRHGDVHVVEVAVAGGLRTGRRVVRAAPDHIL